jgi:hypothetical protein
MMTLFEDLRLALRQICAAIGLSGTAATVVPLIVLGVAMNMAALSAMEFMRNEKHPKNGPIALRDAVRTEVKVMRTVLTSTIKKISDNKRRWCVAQQWVMDRKTEVTGYQLEIGFAWATSGSNEGCGVTVAHSTTRKTAIAFVQC